MNTSRDLPAFRRGGEGRVAEEVEDAGPSNIAPSPVDVGLPASCGCHGSLFEALPHIDYHILTEVLNVVVVSRRPPSQLAAKVEFEDGHIVS